MTKRGKVIAAGVVVLLGLILMLEILSRQTITVNMTDTGYQPGKITIQQGQKVIWKNVGQMERWPASNSHPTHQDYPTEKTSCLGSELDACRAMKNGEQYEFVFETSGSWGMHDHLSPNEGMIVNVSNTGRGWLGRFKLIKQTLTQKPSRTDNITAEIFRTLDYANQQTALEEIAKNNPQAAWELLKEAFIINGQVTQDVHEFAHLIGHAAYDKNGIAGVSICDASFAYGCFHGVAEEAINQQGEEAISKIEQACTDNLEEPKRPSCYHGIGHGTAGIHKLELKPALVACDKLQLANRTYCYDGVFMEHAGAAKDSGISRSDPWSLCENLPDQYHVACARYQPPRLSNAGLDFSAGIISCSQTSVLLLKEHCSRAFGFASVVQGNFDTDYIDSLCGSANNIEASNWCRVAAATEIVFQSYAGWEQTAPALCKKIEESGARSECIYSVANIRNGESR